MGNGKRGETDWCHVSCPTCGKRLRFRMRENAARAGACPNCQTRVELPVPETPVAQPAPETPPRVPLWPPPRELAEVPRPRLPRWPLLQGIYTFPWTDLAALRAWLMLGIGMTILAVLGAFLAYLVGFGFSIEMGELMIVGLILILKAFIVFFIWTVGYAAVDFLAIIGDTSLGIGDIHWPEEALLERLLRVAYLAWIGFLSLMPALPLMFLCRMALSDDALGWSLVPLPLVLFVPFILLGALGNDSWMFVNGEVWLALLKKPVALVVTWVTSAALLCGCCWLGYAVLQEGRYALAPAAGFAWSASLLIYARQLGRLAWIATNAERPRKRRRRRKKKPVEE